jgi:hypothetical protein
MISEHQVVEETRKPSISKHGIRDLDSLNKVTGGSHQVAGLYFYSMLDCLVDLAYQVSKDFFKKPHLYLELGHSHINQEEQVTVAPTLAKLRARYGSDERLPSKEQRDEIYIPIFGQSEGDDKGDFDFPRLRDELLKATATFAERVFDTGVEMLKERVRSAHRPFREYLMGLRGDSVKWSREQALSELTEKVSYPILRNKGVAAVFGISQVPKIAWPYDEDSNGDKLVAEISKHLMCNDPSEMYITREHFSNLQRAALRGAEAIAAIIDFDETGSDEKCSDDDLILLITKCYTWGSALMSIKHYSVDEKPQMNGEVGANRTQWTSSLR